MQNSELIYLFQQYCQKTATPQEQQTFLAYVEQDANKAQLEQVMASYWDTFEQQNDFFSISEREQMLSEIFGQHSQQTQSIPTRKLWPKIAIAAAIATIIFSAGLFYYNLNINKQQPNQITLKNDVAPGKTGATLTLASGKKIKLTDATNGELAKEAGVVITKSANGQLIYEIKESETQSNNINTLSTAKGETYQLRLPDGSLVWLNAASSLTYSANLNERGKRRVRLDGEGYFEIAKDKTHPFVVESRGQVVEVLGTHFNVNAYTNESHIMTTLIEGSVKVSRFSTSEKDFRTPERANNQVILKPGEQAQFSYNHISINKTADLEEVTAWKHGYFKFSDNLETIMHKISRWYDVDVVYNMKPDPEYAFGGEISRSRNLSEVLKVMEFSGKVHFKIEERRIFVNR